MSTEERDFSRASKSPTDESATGVARRPTPIASSDGSASSSNEQAPARRKRVRISAPEERRISLGGRRLSNRFSNRDFETSSREELGERPAPRPCSYNRADYNPNENRGELDQRYQSQREEGNFNYTYSRSTGTPAPARKPGNKTKPNGLGAGKHKKTLKKKTKKFVPPDPVKYQEVIDPATEIRLNKFLANAGVASRREADQLILKGEIMVNGVVATELGMRVTTADEVVYQGKKVESEYKVYILLNKPKNCVTTSDDPECRLTVMDLVRNACPERIYPVGRLDRNTTGVLLITNDGELSSKLTHPSYKKKKIYHVWLNKPVSMEHMQQIADGIELEDGPIHADAVSYVKEDDLAQVGIEIHSGRNRIVRRIFEHLGYRVIKLDRVYFAGLTKKNLPRGRWRYLDEQEVNNLRMGAFE